MKKIILKKASEPTAQRIGYKINYEAELNAAQYEAVMHGNGPALVIAGAGTGKTRTLVYRVARLIEDNNPPESILLLTFTRKSASEMLRRASSLLDGRAQNVAGGTFHSFALHALRSFAMKLGYSQSFTILDQSDSEDAVNLIRSNFIGHKVSKRFPQKATLSKINGLMMNKRASLAEILEKYFPHYEDDAPQIEEILNRFADYKKRHNLMDYDDLLLNLLKLLKEHPDARRSINERHRFLLIDEYQDTNRIQHEIALELAGERRNIMAVGDDAQSIYSFRGADFQNILFFPESFPQCAIYKIEENYRSTQPILDLTNEIIKDSLFKYQKELYTRQTGGETPKVIAAATERLQSEFIVQQLLELREEGIALEEMAVLFRNSFHSFDLEIELEKANIKFVKFGGLRFIETAHIKDLVAFLKIVFNPKDAVSWQRVLLLLPGVGPTSANQIIEKFTGGQADFASRGFLKEIKRGRERLEELFSTLEEAAMERLDVAERLEVAIDFYKPLLREKYDDWQKRERDIEVFLNIAAGYRSIASFLNDIALDPPTESLSQMEEETKETEFVTLSTIHTAKGLEWRAVFLIWALEGRFPSSKAADEVDSIEEERRLFYVACTRAKERLYITYPTNIYDRESGFVLSKPSRFIANISEELAERYVIMTEEEERKGDEDSPRNDYSVN